MSLNRNINTIISRKPAVGFSVEALTYKDRVEADGGEVIDMAYVDSTIKLLKARNLYNINLRNFNSPYFGIKKDAANKVSKFYDLSTNNLDLTQITGSVQPTWSSGSVNYDGTQYVQNYSVSDHFAGEDKPFSIIVACKPSVVTGNKNVLAFGNFTTTTQLLKPLLVTDRHAFAATDDAGLAVADSNTTTLTAATNYILSSVSSGLENKRYENGALKDTVAYNLGIISLTSYIQGALRTGGNEIELWKGDINDVCMFSSNISDAHRADIENHINAKYNYY